MFFSFSSTAEELPTDKWFSACFTDENTESLCWWQMEYEQEPAKLYDFGAHYANGDGVQQSFEQGRYWIHRAAIAGFSLAQYNLGVMFYDGIGGVKSHECARYWLEKAQQHESNMHEMVEQALLTLQSYEQQLVMGAPKVLRRLSTEECAQLPNIVFPKGSEYIHDIMNSKEPTNSEPMLSFSIGHDLLIKNLPKKIISPQIEPVMTQATFDPSTEKCAYSILRNKIGRYLTTLGNSLLDEPSEPIKQLTGGIDVNLLEKSISDVVAINLNPIEMAPLQKIESIVQKKQSRTSAQVLTLPTRVNIDSLNLQGNLAKASKQHYTLQLSSASQAEPLYQLANKHKLSNYLIYETLRNDQKWYVLVYGEYTGIKQAKKAIETLPEVIKKQAPWVRNISHVQSELP